MGTRNGEHTHDVPMSLANTNVPYASKSQSGKTFPCISAVYHDHSEPPAEREWEHAAIKNWAKLHTCTHLHPFCTDLCKDFERE